MWDQCTLFPSAVYCQGSLFSSELLSGQVMITQVFTYKIGQVSIETFKLSIEDPRLLMFWNNWLWLILRYNCTDFAISRCFMLISNRRSSPDEAINYQLEDFSLRDILSLCLS